MGTKVKSKAPGPAPRRHQVPAEFEWDSFGLTPDMTPREAVCAAYPAIMRSAFHQMQMAITEPLRAAEKRNSPAGHILQPDSALDYERGFLGGLEMAWRVVADAGRALDESRGWVR